MAHPKKIVKVTGKPTDAALTLQSSTGGVGVVVVVVVVIAYADVSPRPLSVCFEHLLNAPNAAPMSCRQPSEVGSGAHAIRIRPMPDHRFSNRSFTHQTQPIESM